MNNLGSFFITIILFQALILQSCDRYQDIDQNGKVIANFTYEARGRTITFTNNSIGHSDSKWYFGDGNESAESSPKHDYINYGEKLVRLVVSNGIDSAAIQQKINLEIAPNIFRLEPTFSGVKPYFNLGVRKIGVSKDLYIELSLDSFFNYLVPAQISGWRDVETYSVKNEEMATQGKYVISHLAPKTFYFIRIREEIIDSNHNLQIFYSNAERFRTEPIASPQIKIELVENWHRPIWKIKPIKGIDNFNELEIKTKFILDTTTSFEVFPLQSASVKPFSVYEYVGTDIFFKATSVHKTNNHSSRPAYKVISNPFSFRVIGWTPRIKKQGSKIDIQDLGQDRYRVVMRFGDQETILVNLGSKVSNSYTMISGSKNDNENHIIYYYNGEKYLLNVEDASEIRFELENLSGSTNIYARKNLHGTSFTTQDKTKSVVLYNVDFRLN